MINEPTSDLARLGGAIEAAAREELARRRRVTPRRLAVAAVVLAIVIPGAAIAADQLIGNNDVAQSMPAGALVLAETEPTCTTVTANVEYHCLLAHKPAPDISDYTGTVYQTVDATRHVNGGCRSLNSAGTEWECYIGQAAVDQRIISEGFLGQVETTPAVG